MHKFTVEQRDFISANIVGTRTCELTQMINSHFGLNLKRSQIRAYIKNHKLKSGLSYTFKQGHTPTNKGKKNPRSWGATQFKKGNIPHNIAPIGTTNTNGEGYLVTKVAYPDKWEFTHRLIWEELHGPIPKGMVLLFGDGNKLNVDIVNLILVTRQQLLVLNKRKLIQNSVDGTRTGIIIADLYQKISKKIKK